jgi:hypothetical protein
MLTLNIKACMTLQFSKYNNFSLYTKSSLLYHTYNKFPVLLLLLLLLLILILLLMVWLPPFKKPLELE